MSLQQRQQAAQREKECGKFQAPGGWVHPYSHALINAPEQFYDYQSLKIEWATVDPYEVTRKIGRGKYSDVFMGRNRHNHEKCVIKILKPVKEQKILREVSILQNLYGGPNVVRLLDVAIESDTQTPILVFEAVESEPFRTLYPKFTDMDVRYYMYQICKCLDFCHAMGIMHRDIKPHNVMIDHRRHLVRVIDWGLAEYYHHGTPYNVRVASRYYKGPELLVGFRYYDYMLDMWSLGCMLGGILFEREPLFHGKDNTDQLLVILRITGTQDLRDYLARYNIALPDVYDGQIKEWPKVPWRTLVPSGSALCNAEAMDFVDKLLQFDHAKRIMAKDALAHPYFDPVRAAAEAAVQAFSMPSSEGTQRPPSPPA